MTVLQSLDRYYGRLAARGEADPYGYSRESIGASIWLDADGSIKNVFDRHEYSGKKPAGVRLAVPQAVNRASGIASNFLWDKTAYTLGVTAGEGKRTAREHEAFKALHRERLADTADPGLRALLAFLTAWTPDHFAADKRFTAIMLDKNMVFEFGEDREYLHDRSAAQALITAPSGSVWQTAFCLVTGQQAPIERLHPVVKGVDGAQTAGAKLVSYNANAFNSYGAEGGANAPTSEAAAFRYGTALNRLLDRGSANRLKIGDATVAFWADAEGVGEAAAAAAEAVFGIAMDMPTDDSETAKIRNCLADISDVRPVEAFNPALKPGTRFHILGLSPNAARISVRYWLSDEFGAFVRRLADHYQDIAIEPAPWHARLPSIQRLLVKTTALLEKFENIPPHLAGEFTRAVLEGQRYPRALLTNAVMRLRAGDDPGNGWHAAIIKACVNRSEQEHLPVARDTEYQQTSYQLGRLFAVMEAAQKAALGRQRLDRRPLLRRRFGHPRPRVRPAAARRPPSYFGCHQTRQGRLDRAAPERNHDQAAARSAHLAENRRSGPVRGRLLSRTRLARRRTGRSRDRSKTQ